MSYFSDEWVRGPDGLLHRHGARVLVFDGAGRVLLQRGHDIDEPSRHWWFTPGGGIRTGEDPRAAAVRELAEETGIVVSPGDLEGPVARRSAIFDFAREWVRQDEVFFVARIPGGRLDDSGWSDAERLFMLEQLWVAVDAIAALDGELFPEELPAFAAALLAGWDGTVRELAREDTRTSPPAEGDAR